MKEGTEALNRLNSCLVHFLDSTPQVGTVQVELSRSDAEQLVVHVASHRKEVHDLRNELASALAEAEILKTVMEVEPGADDEELGFEASMQRSGYVADRGTPQGARCARLASWLEELRRSRTMLERSKRRVHELELAMHGLLTWRNRYAEWLRQWLPKTMFEALEDAVARCLDAVGGDLLKESACYDAPPDGSLRQVAKRLGFPTCSRCGEPARELSAGLCVDCAPDDGWPSSGSKEK